LSVLSSIKKESISFYGLSSCKKWLPQLSLSDFNVKHPAGRRDKSISIYVDEELDDLLLKFNPTKNSQIKNSQVLERCLILEVHLEISKWECETPEEFIQLMTSETPLKASKTTQVIDLANMRAVA